MHQPAYPTAYYHLGRALTQQQRYEEAIAAFEREREVSPRGFMADLGTGQTYLAQGQYDKALAFLSKDLQPAAINYFWLGATYAARGDKEKALATMQKAFDLGFRDFAALDASPYFASLRSDLQFQQLTGRYRK